MSKILYVTSSPRGAESFSNQVAARVLEELKEAHPGAEVIHRDVAHDPLPHIDEDFLAAMGLREGSRTPRQREIAARSDALIDEVMAADVIVIAAPMYNFSIPSTLKSWVDYIARAGRTFRYTEKGPEGLVKGKKAILIHSRGGVYSSGPTQALDHQGKYLRSVLGFLGITDVQSIDVEGVAYGPDAAKQAVASGLQQARPLVCNTLAAAA
jgi:FMN-dependent NADH-azoreductase